MAVVAIAISVTLVTTFNCAVGRCPNVAYLLRNVEEIVFYVVVGLVVFLIEFVILVERKKVPTAKSKTHKSAETLLYAFVGPLYSIVASGFLLATFSKILSLDLSCSGYNDEIFLYGIILTFLLEAVFALSFLRRSWTIRRIAVLFGLEVTLTAIGFIPAILIWLIPYELLVVEIPLCL